MIEAAGKNYIVFTSEIPVVSLGHSYPAIAEAIIINNNFD